MHRGAAAQPSSSQQHVPAANNQERCGSDAIALRNMRGFPCRLQAAFVPNVVHIFEIRHNPVHSFYVLLLYGDEYLVELLNHRSRTR